MRRSCRIFGFSLSMLLAVTPSVAWASMQSPLSSLAMPFLANAGQAAPDVAFYAPTFAGTVFVTHEGELVYALPGWSVIEESVGGKGAPRAGKKAETRASFFLGSDAAAWRGAVSTYRSVELGEVWPGISYALQAHGNNVEKLFLLAPHARAEAIRMQIRGVHHLRLEADGSLRGETGLGDVRWSAPVAYQERGAERRSVAVSYTVSGNQYGFRLGVYDASLPVVIDPLLQSTYAGGSGFDTGINLAVHPTSGEIYLGGSSSSADFPGTAGGAQPAWNGQFRDGYVARFNSSLTSLLQATYVGGIGLEFGGGLAIHPTTGEVYLSGFTDSKDFPATVGGAQATKQDSDDAFIARFDSSLTSLLQSTYAGGDGRDLGNALAIHPTSGEVYLVGQTTSPDFPAVASGGQPVFGGGGFDSFLARFNSTLTTLPQATFLGGTDFDSGLALAIHPTSGDVYLCGITNSNDVPGTAGGAQPAAGAGDLQDALVGRFNSALTSLLQATYLGGSGDLDHAHALAIHPVSGEIYVAGVTDSSDFPGVAGGAQSALDDLNDGFVTRLNSDLTSLLQSTYMGGGGDDVGLALAVHPLSGEVYLTGLTESIDFPGTTEGAQPVFGGGIEDAFVARFSSSLTSLRQATYLGGAVRDLGFDLTLVPVSGIVYVAGISRSTNFPGTTGGAQPANGGFEDAFVSMLTDDLAGEVLFGPEVPTLSAWSLGLLLLLLGGVGVRSLSRRGSSS